MKAKLQFILYYTALLIVLGMSSSLVVAQNDDGNGWVNYGNVLVTWELADCSDDGIDANDGYQYLWGSDRNLDGDPNDGTVLVDYGRYGGLQERTESGWVDFGCYVGLDYFTNRTIHLTETWVAGVTVPGGSNNFVVRDNDGDGIYTGGFTTTLFWDGFTQQGDPPGPYNIRNRFEYTFNATGADGLVVSGDYVQRQYLMIPDEE